jgi:site-specific recombinase XerD
MKLSRAVAEWLKEVRTEHPSTSTASAYESDLHRLVSYLPIDTILRFTTEALRDYFEFISSQGVKPSTLHRKMAAVSAFGKWGKRQKLWHENPMDSIKRVRRPKHLPRPFSKDEAERLLALELPPTERVVRALLFFTGIRVTPLCMLKAGDVDYDAPSIRAWVKGAKTQVIQMHPDLRDLLYDYVLSHHNLKPQDPLVPQKNGRRYHRRTLERMVAGWGVKASVPNCLPHRARHSFATNLLKAGVDIRIIKDAMGHEDIASTALYTLVADEDVKHAIGRLTWGKV